MANILVTGGTGFMGRWISKYLVEHGHGVWILDNLSNSCEANIEEFRDRLKSFIKGDVKDKGLISKLFENHFEICIHLAAAINVQESINNPQRYFSDNITGTGFRLEITGEYYGTTRISGWVVHADWDADGNGTEDMMWKDFHPDEL